MTTTAATQPHDSPPEPEVDNYLTYTRGFRSWALTLDHKRIGIMYLVSVLGSFLVGGIFALLVRTELLTPGATIPGVDENLYNQFFTLHGAIMVFLGDHSLDSRGPRKLCVADHAGCERRRIPATEPRQLLPLGYRCHLRGGLAHGWWV